MSQFNTPTRNLTVSTTYKPTTTVYYSATLPSATKVYSAGLRTSTIHLEDSLREIKQRYETEAKTVQHNYETDYNKHLSLVKQIEELEDLLEAERRKTYEIEVKYTTVVTELENEKRLRSNVEHEVVVLKDKLRQAEALLSEAELELNRAHQDNKTLNTENISLRKEIERLTDLYNSKLREIEDQYLLQKRQLNSEIDRIKAQIEQQRLAYENRLQALEREAGLKYSRFEEIIREKETIIAKLESELRFSSDSIAQLKIQYEEELRRQIALVRDEEKSRYDALARNFEAKLRQLQEERDLLLRRNQEMGRELIAKEKQYQEFRTQLEAELAQYKLEISDLRNQVRLLTVDKEKLVREISNKEAIIYNLESEIANFEREIQRLKDAHTQEINRLVNEHSNERRRWEEVERQLRVKIEEFERYVRVLESENSKLKHDIEKLKQMVSGNIQQTLVKTFQEYDISQYNAKSIF